MKARLRWAVTLSWVLLGLACGTEEPARPTDVVPAADQEVGELDGPSEAPCTIEVTVRLDGTPTAEISVGQGGHPDRWLTGEDGKVTVTLNRSIEGDMAVVASHPEARTRGEVIYEGMCSVTLDLVRFDDADNEAYVFKDPGTPDHSPSTQQCGHCHQRVNAGWHETPHRTSASNPAVQDLYRGEASAMSTQPDCETAGGQWVDGSVPGQETIAQRCYLGEGVIGALNPDCVDLPCAQEANAFGGCADCHAPGIDGALGGRDLRDAQDHAYDYGVHCEVCHHVESIEEGAPAGVAGWLNVVRPSEPSTSSFLGDWTPLLFGPDDDVPVVLMGMVPRAHFKESRFCAGCHQLNQEVLVPGATLDLARWPDGVLPIHTTWSEWQESSYNGVLPCQGCHMPGDPEALNGAGLEKAPDTAGLAAGWARPTGTVNQHSWPGPRATSTSMLEGAAALSGSATLDGATLQVAVEVTNVGAGHAIPTGEPLRQMILAVTAACDGETLPATDGPAIPAHGGYLAQKVTGEDWMVWPEAAPGDALKVVRVPGEHLEYQGPGPFGDGTFAPDEKGLLVESVAGTVTVEGVVDGVVTLSGPLPEGEHVYLQRPSSSRAGLAGDPGALFARVLTGADGRAMAPHFLAVDIQSDNRLMPGAAWATSHTFSSPCSEPTVTATLIHRAYPHFLAVERDWSQRDRVMKSLTLTPDTEP